MHNTNDYRFTWLLYGQINYLGQSTKPIIEVATTQCVPWGSDRLASYDSTL